MRPRTHFTAVLAMLCAAAFIAVAASGQTLAPGVSLVPVAQGYGGLNTASFTRHNLVSLGSTQYIAFYNPATNVVVGRRMLGTTTWETNQTNFGPNNAADGHDIISIGIGSDGILHCSWGMHGDTFHYARSTAAWSLSLVATNMTGNENTVTYPQFLNLPNGDLLYLFREGTSGNGDTYLNRYSSTTHTWTNVHITSGAQSPFIKGTGITPVCNAYPNFACLDSKTNLVLTWTWRDNAASIDYNHDTLYARSPDYGVTWLRTNGVTYTLPITRNTADNVFPIAQNMQLMNQCGQAIDTNDRPVIATWWAPGGSGTPIQIFLIWYNGAAWVTNQVGSRSTTNWPTRPICLVDKSNRVLLVFSDIERGNVPTLAYTSDPNRATWSFANLTSEDLGSESLGSANLGGWEATYDPVVWQRDGKLHMFYQRMDGSAGGTPISVLEFDPEYFFSNAPPANVIYDWAGGAGTGTWSQASNWTNAAAPPVGGATNLLLSFRGSTAYTATNNLAGTLVLNSLQLAGTAAVTNTITGNALAFVSNATTAPTINQSGVATFQVANGITITNTVSVLCGGSGVLTLAGGVTGSGALAVSGSGTLVLAGTNTFTGGLTQSSGTLRIASAAAFGGAPASFVSNQFTLGSATLQVNATTSLNDTNTGVFVSGTGVFQVDTNVAFTIANAISGNGTMTKRDAGTLILSGSNSLSGTLYLDRGIDGNNNDGVTRITASGAVANFTTLAIRNTSVSTAGGATLQLDGSAGGLVLMQNVTMSCRNNSSVATIQNLAGTNTLGGTNFVDVGGQYVNFQTDANSQLTIAGPIQYIGSLTGQRIYNFFGAGNVIVSGVIRNSTNGAPVSLTKSGTGTLTLTAVNTYGSTTTVSNGALLVNGSISTGAVTVASGATLGGSGTINGPVTIANGATLSPGGSPGTLTVNGNLVLNNSSTLAYELGTSSDRTVVNGNLTLDGVLTVTDAGGFAAGNYTLITYTGTLTDNGLVVNNPLPGGRTGSIVAGGGTVVLQVTGGDPFATWQSQYFGSTNCALCGGNVDFDGDSLSNTNEFLAGFNPTNPAAYPHIISITISNGTDIAITYLGANGDTNYPGGPLTRTNVLECAPGTGDGGYTNNFVSTGVTNILSGGTGVGVVTNMVDPGGATNQPARYYRVRVLVP